MPGNRQVFDLAMKRGHAFARQQAWDKANAEYQRALAEFPDDTVALIAAGTVLLNLNRLPDALTALQHLNEVKPGDVATLEKIADAQERLGNRSDAARTCVAIGDLLLQQGNTEQAVSAWTRATQLDADNVEARQKLIAAYQAQGQLKLVVSESIWLAHIYQKNGQLDLAAQQCKTALALDPRNAEALKMMGEIRITRGTGPLPPLQESLSAVPRLPAPSTEPAPAWGGLETTVATESAKPDTPVDIASRKARSELAESIFEENFIAPPRPTAQLTKKAMDALVGQALDLQSRRQTQQAIAAYRHILDAVEWPAASFSLGVFYEQELAFDQAIEQFQQSAKHTEYTLGSQFALGECYRALGQDDEALRHFVEALEIVDLSTVKVEQADDLRAAYEHMADNYLKGEREQAKQFTNAVIEFLSSKGWEELVIAARQRLDSLTDENAPRMSLAEMIMVPNFEAVLQSLSLTHEYIQSGKMYPAMEEIYAAIVYAPDYLPLHRLMADMLWDSGHEEAAVTKYTTIANTSQARGDYNQAVAVYQRILRLMPMDLQTRSLLIHLLISHGEIDQALEQYMALADAHYQLAQIDKAREIYEQTMDLVPRASKRKDWTQQILHKIGDIDVQRIDWRRAIQSYEQIKSIAPDDEKARLSLVELCFTIADSARAIRELDDLLVSYTTSGKARKIIPALEDQARNHPNEMGVRSRLARAYLGAGLTAQAIEQLDALGDLQLQAGLQKEAATTIRGIIALNPPNVEQYKQILAQLGTTGSLHV